MKIFGLVSRTNDFHYRLSDKNLNANFIVDFFDDFSFKITRQTVVVIDNASIHTAKKVRALLDTWQKRGLYIFFLPPYSPHLNIAERLWKEMKGRWIKPTDYQEADRLFYAVNRICANIGKELTVNFSPFKF